MLSIQQRLTLEEYLTQDNQTDQQYEFVDGALIEMPPESRLNSRISFFLALELAKLIPISQIAHKDTEIETAGRVRLPDLIVLLPDHAELLKQRGTITRDMPPPLLVIEVVSPGKANQDRDYRYKRSEYAARGIPEYWIVDPYQERVIVLTLVDGFYEEKTFEGSAMIQSLVLPQIQLTLQLTVQRVLSAGEMV
jgi:Uma2 family endonuclease